MFGKPLATEGDVRRLLGEIDPLMTSRILAIAPSVDELDEAIQASEDEAAFAEEPRTPSSARVANVREVLADLMATELDEPPTGDRR